MLASHRCFLVPTAAAALTILFGCLAANPASAAITSQPQGRSLISYLSTLAPDARALATGSALTTLDPHIGSVSGNPGGLGLTEASASLEFSHGALRPDPADQGLDFFTVSRRRGPLGIGLHWRHYGFGGTPVYRPSGSIERVGKEDDQVWLVGTGVDVGRLWPLPGLRLASVFDGQLIGSAHYFGPQVLHRRDAIALAVDMDLASHLHVGSLVHLTAGMERQGALFHGDLGMQAANHMGAELSFAGLAALRAGMLQDDVGDRGWWKTWGGGIGPEPGSRCAHRFGARLDWARAESPVGDRTEAGVSLWTRL